MEKQNQKYLFHLRVDKQDPKRQIEQR